MKVFSASYTMLNTKVIFYTFSYFFNGDALRDLVPFVQFKKHEKHPCRSGTSACNIPKSITSPWVFFTFFNLYKWYKIAQSIAHFVFQEGKGRIRVYDHFFSITSI